MRKNNMHFGKHGDTYLFAFTLSEEDMKKLSERGGLTFGMEREKVKGKGINARVALHIGESEAEMAQWLEEFLSGMPLDWLKMDKWDRPKK